MHLAVEDNDVTACRWKKGVDGQDEDADCGCYCDMFVVIVRMPVDVQCSLCHAAQTMPDAQSVY